MLRIMNKIKKPIFTDIFRYFVSFKTCHRSLTSKLDDILFLHLKKILPYNISFITEKNKDVLHEKTLFRIDIMLGLELNLLEAINELMFKQKVFHLHK